MLTPDMEETFERFLASRDGEAFSRFYQASSPFVFTICLRLLRVEEDAADAMQATYERLLKSIQSGESKPKGSDLPSWLALLARREADNLRHRRNRRSDREREAPIMTSHPDTPREEASSREVTGMIHQAIDELPEDLAAVVSLHLLHGMSQKDLASMYEVSQPAISRRIAKGLRLLRLRLRKMGLTEGATAIGVVGTLGWTTPPAKASTAILSGLEGMLGAGTPPLAATGTLGYLGGVVMKGKLLAGGAALVLVAAVTILVLVNQTGEKAGPEAPPPIFSDATVSQEDLSPTDTEVSVMIDDPDHATGPSPTAPLEEATPPAVWGTVIDEATGKSIPGATVAWREGDLKTIADENGSFHLEFPDDVAGTRVHLYGWTTTHHPVPDDPAVEIAGSGGTGPVEVPVRRGQDLIGKATHAITGEPLPGVRVAIQEEGLPGVPREDVTDNDGVYMLEGLPLSGVAVEAGREGFMTLTRVVRFSEDVEARSDFEMRPTGTVNLVVRNTAGEPVPGATVLATSGQFRMLYPYDDTDSEGRSLLMDIPLHDVQIIVSQQGYKDGNVNVQFPEGVNVTELVVTLEEDPRNVGGWYTGVVTDEAGNPIEGARVTWEQSGNFVGRKMSGTSTRSDGVYLIEVQGTPFPETVHLAVLADSFAATYLTHHELPPPGKEDNPARVDIRLRAEQWLGITLVNTEGEKITSRVRLLPHLTGIHGARRALPGYTSPVETTDGTALLGNLPDRPILLVIMTGNYNEKQVTIEELNRNVELVLEEQYPFRGQVVDEDTGDPIAVFRVRVNAPGTSIGLWDAGVDFTSPDGTFLIEGIPGGNPATIRVESTGYIPFQSVPGDDHEVVISREPVTIPMTRGREVAGIVIDSEQNPIGGAGIRLHRTPHRRVPAETIDQTTSGPDGRFTLREGIETAHLEATHEGMGTLHLAPSGRADHQTDEGLVLVLFPAGSITARAPTEGTFTPIHDTDGYTDGLVRNPFSGRMLDAMQGREGTWEGLLPGVYQVIFQPGVGTMMNIVVTVEVKAGETSHIDFADTLGPLHVSISLTDPTGTTAPDNRWNHPRLWLHPEENPRVVYMRDRFNPGDASFPQLPPGTYRAIVEHLRQGLGFTEYGHDLMEIDSSGTYTFQWNPMD